MATSVLDAATREFAAHGPDGADLDRIAAEAGTDTSTILREFGSADALFDRVVAESTSALTRSVRLDPDDLPRFAGDVFEAMQRDGTILRLSMWQALERPGADAEERLVVAEWLRRVSEEGGGSSEMDAFSPAELLTYALALAKAELIAPRLLAEDLTGENERAERRAHVEEAVRRVVGYHV
jgi:AcrR family transcriptional regulator